MKTILSKNSLLYIIIILLLFTFLKANAQHVDSKTAGDLVRQHAVAIGIAANDLQNFRVSDAYYDKNSGLTLVYVQQTYKGIDIYNSIQTVAFKNGKVVSKAGTRISVPAELINTKEGKAFVSSENAVRSAAGHLGLLLASPVTAKKAMTSFKETEYGDLGISSINIRSKLIWLGDEKSGRLILAWQVAIQPKGKSDLWYVNVDALKNQIISKINLNIICDWKNAKHLFSPDNDLASKTSLTNNGNENNTDELVSKSKYKVVPFPAESPLHAGGGAVIRTNPWSLAGAGNSATTLQWHDDGSTTYDSTRGNNVLAQEDRNGNNGFGKGAVSTTSLPTLTFNSNPNFSKQPTINANQRFAITNLFYWNNIMHDISYQYGFNEVSGNFQANNLGRGGLGNDYVFADAQDGSGTDNANFATPADGSNPRMQMFLFTAVPQFTVNQPTSFAGLKDASESGFSTANKLSNVGTKTGNVVIYQDNSSGTSHLACGAAFNAAALSGKIALIDRGTCGFTDKVKNAQNAGAIAAIVADNIPGEYPFTMGGTDNTITIPAILIRYETGDTIKQLIGGGTNVNVTMKQGVQLDGDLDNGVISHEYTHGISNRLTGGPGNTGCLSNKEQMGEGWSDYMALMVTTNWSTATVNDGPKARPLGTYVLGQTPAGPGIRYYPYSTDFNVNPWTYDSMALSSRFSNSLFSYDPHIVGEVWCNMLWEMTWEIIKASGINTNIYSAGSTSGNTVALQLVIQGMKLQVCSPGFVDGRDAILKADSLLYGASHSAAIWKAFARRGLGKNANEGSSNNIKDGTADYSVPTFTAIVRTPVQEQLRSNIKVTLSPNPAKDKVTIYVASNTKPLKILLSDATGKQFTRADMKGTYLQLNLPKVTPGIYYITIKGETINHTEKIMIQ